MEPLYAEKAAADTKDAPNSADAAPDSTEAAPISEGGGEGAPPVAGATADGVELVATTGEGAAG